MIGWQTLLAHLNGICVKQAYDYTYRASLNGNLHTRANKFHLRPILGGNAGI